MKRIKTCLVVTLLIALGVPTPAATQTAPPTSAISRSATVPSGNGSDQAAPAREVFKVGASVRLRTEVRDDSKFGSTNPGNDEQYLLTQMRVNATWNPATRATVFVEIQDARIFGEEGIDQDATPKHFRGRARSPPRLPANRSVLGSASRGPYGRSSEVQPGRPTARLISGVGQHRPGLGRGPPRCGESRRANIERLRFEARPRESPESQLA